MLALCVIVILFFDYFIKLFEIKNLRILRFIEHEKYVTKIRYVAVKNCKSILLLRIKEHVQNLVVGECFKHIYNFNLLSLIL